MKTPVFVFLGLHLTDGEWHPFIVRRPRTKQSRQVEELKELIREVLREHEEGL